MALKCIYTGRKDGFAINLQMCKFVSTLQWSFYYLCDTKFAIHTLMPLHIRKFMGSNLQQICNGCFIIFTIPNLQYIHSYLFTYANSLHEICIRFAMVVLLSLLYQICNTYTHKFTHTQIHWIKFASDLQWLFCYLYHTKFAIHTHILLHIRKSFSSNLH